ncbi:MAG: hypothetical protein FJ098_15490 [Deltaproteobacteria bacterium]|nr:hypothetical protein [Deltaproteobacteria bacterium]
MEGTTGHGSGGRGSRGGRALRAGLPGLALLLLTFTLPLSAQADDGTVLHLPGPGLIVRIPASLRAMTPSSLQGRAVAATFFGRGAGFIQPRCQVEVDTTWRTATGIAETIRESLRSRPGARVLRIDGALALRSSTQEHLRMLHLDVFTSERSWHASCLLAAEDAALAEGCERALGSFRLGLPPAGSPGYVDAEFGFSMEPPLLPPRESGQPDAILYGPLGSARGRDGPLLSVSLLPAGGLEAAAAGVEAALPQGSVVQAREAVTVAGRPALLLTTGEPLPRGTGQRFVLVADLGRGAFTAQGPLLTSADLKLHAAALREMLLGVAALDADSGR